MATTKRKASKSAVKSTTKRGVTKAKAKAKAGNTTKAKAAPAKAKGKTKPVAKAKTSKAAAKTMPVAKAKTSKAAAKTMPVAKAKTSKAAAKTKTKPSRDNAKQREFVQRLESAIALQHLGDNQGAVDAFMDIFVDFPDDARLPEEAGNISLYALNDPLKAVECYAKALPLVDDPTELCHKIGFAYASADDDENASRWFAQAHYHTPTHAPTFLEVAKLNMRSERFDDALAYFDTAWAHHVMDTGMFGGPSPHFQALVLMNQAR
ncbi:MAG TPA: tetratricopeptide repeat protein, partial [Kofleriaceae bacterium]|nr:tetratricopeptide repeat protein [Kofleriaceae bacterium]